MLSRCFILCLITFAFCLCTSRSQGSLFLKPQKEGFGDCIDDEWQSHPVGTTWTSKKKCEMYECLFINGILYVRGSSCGALGYSSDCELVPGEGTEYPDCCPKVVCPEVEYDYYYER